MREICRGLEFPEGPVAMPDGSIVPVEIRAGRVTRVRPDGARETVAECGGGPNGAALGPDGRIHVCNNGGFVWIRDGAIRRPGDVTPPDYRGGSIQAVDPDTSAVETLYAECGGVLLNGPNDIVFDAGGGFYFTDLGRRRGRVMDRGAVYYARPGGGLSKVLFPIDTPNGIGLSADEKTLYIAETAGARIWARDIVAPGVLGPALHSMFPGRLLYRGAGYERFDSLALDSEGNIVVATLGTGCVTAVSPEGRVRAVVPVPEFDSMVTNICFGGPDLRTAWITSSGLGVLYAMEWHWPGQPLNFLNRQPRGGGPIRESADSAD